MKRKFKRLFLGRGQKRSVDFLWVAAILFVFGSYICFAQGSVLGMNMNISYFIATSLYKLVQAAGFLLGIAMWCLNLVTSAEFYDKVLFSTQAKDAINLGWQVVRDFLNLFFILILLLIAIGTILRIPSYGDKKMVFNVVIAALLINFSKPIALFFIDLSQLAMSFFMQAINAGGLEASFSEKILNNIELQKVLDNKGNVIAGDSNYAGAIIVSVTAIIFFLVMAVMLFVLAVALLIRVISFWILIILSPLAMFGLAMPRSGIGSFSRNWMQKMLHWSFFGPVQLFFMWLAVLILQKVSVGSLDAYNFSVNIPSIKTDYTEITLGAFKVVLPFVAAIYLLFYGYDMAKNFAEGGAKKVLDWGSKKMDFYGKKWGKMAAFGLGGAAAIGMGGWTVAGAGAAGLGAYYGGRSMARRGKNLVGAYRRGFQERLGEKFSPFKTKEQKEEKEKELREERIARAKGPEELKKHWRGRANKKKKEWDDLGVDDVFLKEKMKKGDQGERKAAAMLLAEKGKINDENDFQEALVALNGDEVLENNLKKKLKEENMYSYATHDIIHVQDVMKRSITDEELYKSLGKNSLMKNLAKLEGVNVDDQTEMTDFLKKEKNLSKENFKQKVYDYHLDSLTPKQLANQNTLLYEKEKNTLKNYFSRKMKFKGDSDDIKGKTKSEKEYQKELEKQGNGKRASLAADILKEAKNERDVLLNSSETRTTMRDMSE